MKDKFAIILRMHFYWVVVKALTQLKLDMTWNHFLTYFVNFSSSRLTFTNPDKDDLGRYSVVVTDTDGVSASHTLTEDGMFGFPALISINKMFIFKMTLHLFSFIISHPQP